MTNNVLSHSVDEVVQERNKRMDNYSYKLQTGGYGLDVQFGQHFDINENEMSVTIPFADGNRRDGVGDLLEVGGIDTERHRKNPIFLFDHGKQISLPVGKTEDPNTGEYTVFLDPQSKVASCKAFFYQGGSSYEHGLFCEQLFDLIAKKFIRAGSIGYLVKMAQKLPPQYETGTPQGLHLLSTLMLEASTVVLPANQDTIRKALCLSESCGKPLSPYLIKSLASYVDEAQCKVISGYEEKAYAKNPKATRSRLSQETIDDLRQRDPYHDREGNIVGIDEETGLIDLRPGMTRARGAASEQNHQMRGGTDEKAIDRGPPRDDSAEAYLDAHRDLSASGDHERLERFNELIRADTAKEVEKYDDRATWSPEELADWRRSRKSYFPRASKGLRQKYLSKATNLPFDPNRSSRAYDEADDYVRAAAKRSLGRRLEAHESQDPERIASTEEIATINENAGRITGPHSGESIDRYIDGAQRGMAREHTRRREQDRQVSSQEDEKALKKDKVAEQQIEDQRRRMHIDRRLNTPDFDNARMTENSKRTIYGPGGKPTNTPPDPVAFQDQVNDRMRTSGAFDMEPEEPEEKYLSKSTEDEEERTEQVRDEIDRGEREAGLDPRDKHTPEFSENERKQARDYDRKLRSGEIDEPVHRILNSALDDDRDIRRGVERDYAQRARGHHNLRLQEAEGAARDQIRERAKKSIQATPGQPYKTNLPPARWRPGAGAIKALRHKYGTKAGGFRAEELNRSSREYDEASDSTRAMADSMVEGRQRADEYSRRFEDSEAREMSDANIAEYEAGGMIAGPQSGDAIRAMDNRSAAARRQATTDATARRQRANEEFQGSVQEAREAWAKNPTEVLQRAKEREDSPENRAYRQRKAGSKSVQLKSPRAKYGTKSTDDIDNLPDEYTPEELADLAYRNSSNIETDQINMRVDAYVGNERSANQERNYQASRRAGYRQRHHKKDIQMGQAPQIGQRVTAKVPIVRRPPGAVTGPPEYLQAPMTAIGPANEQAVAIRDSVGRVTNAIVNDEIAVEAPRKKLRGLQAKYLKKSADTKREQYETSRKIQEELDRDTEDLKKVTGDNSEGMEVIQWPPMGMVRTDKNFETPESARDNRRLADLHNAPMTSADYRELRNADRDKKRSGSSIHSDSRDREESQIYNQMLPEGRGEHYMQAANLSQVRRAEDSLGNQISQEELTERQEIAARTRQRMQKPESKSIDDADNEIKAKKQRENYDAGRKQSLREIEQSGQLPYTRAERDQDRDIRDYIDRSHQAGQYSDPPRSVFSDRIKSLRSKYRVKSADSGTVFVSSHIRTKAKKKEPDQFDYEVKTQRHPHPSKIEHRKRAARAAQGANTAGGDDNMAGLPSGIEELDQRDRILKQAARSGQQRAAQSAQELTRLQHGETTEDAERRIRNAYKDREVGVDINADSEQIGRARNERRSQGENIPRIPQEREEQGTSTGMQQRMREVTQEATNRRQRVEAVNAARQQQPQSEEQKSFSKKTKGLRAKYKTQRYPHPSKIASKDRAQRARERGVDEATVEDIQHSHEIDQQAIGEHRRRLADVGRGVSVARGTGFIPDDDQSAEQLRQELEQHENRELRQTLRDSDNRQLARAYTDR